MKVLAIEDDLLIREISLAAVVEPAGAAQ